jgi:hypothetical protein
MTGTVLRATVLQPKAVVYGNRCNDPTYSGGGLAARFACVM